MNSHDLERLSHLYGIESQYHDIHGEIQLASDATKLALLRAMGVRADDDESLAAAISERHGRPWRRLVAPVLVVRHSSGPIRVPLHLPERYLSRRVEWQLETEDGVAHAGSSLPARLAEAGRSVIDEQLYVACLLPLPFTLSEGYHILRVGLRSSPALQEFRMRLIAVPDTCFPFAGGDQGRRSWGPAIQLYALRSRRNWGIGDFADLAALSQIGGRLGADVVGLSPMHALDPGELERASPYSPSSRGFLNDLYLDVESIEDFDECEEARRRCSGAEFRQELDRLRQNSRIDYSAVSTRKRSIVEQLYRHFRTHHLDVASDRGNAFRAFQASGGEALRGFGVFEALREHFRARSEPATGWPAWPEPFRDPGSDAVAEFGRANRERAEYFEYLQWQADLQLGLCARRCADAGLGIGLYRDLAVGVDADGFDAWWRSDLFARGARVGAPPDDFNPQGQDWGLPPWIPDRLEESAYEPFIACLRANMRHAGALRIDHVMGLMRLFWVPPGAKPAEGAYVRYPFEDLLGILALESRRNRCAVIGEDLGTVPQEIRDALEPSGALSCRLFYFMRDAAGEFIEPQDYPEQALVAVGTHDLPTLTAYWTARDIELRAELGLSDAESRDGPLAERADARTRVLAALDRQGLRPDVAGDHAEVATEPSPELVTAIHRFLARSPARVMTFRPEDLLGQVDQVNLPGTTAAHCNWRRKLDLSLEDWEQDSRIVETTRALGSERDR